MFTTTGFAAERMPDLVNALPYPEWEGKCSANGIELVVHEYDTLETQKDPYIKYVVVFIKGESVPFMLMEDTDTSKEGAMLRLYYDFDLDGFVDLQKTNMDEDALTACEAAEKVRKKP